jgi:hypothetical protein
MFAKPLNKEQQRLLARFVAKVVEYLEAHIDYDKDEYYKILPRDKEGLCLTVSLFVGLPTGGWCRKDFHFSLQECLVDNDARAEILVETGLSQALFRFRKRPIHKFISEAD